MQRIDAPRNVLLARSYRWEDQRAGETVSFFTEETNYASAACRILRFQESISREEFSHGEINRRTSD